MNDESELDLSERTLVGDSYDCIHHVENQDRYHPILKHFDPDRIPEIVVYASKWAVSASILQEYDGVY